MKRFTFVLSILIFVTCATLFSKKIYVIHAQTLPYNLTVTWDASPDSQSYSCYLDGVKVVNTVTGLTCSFPVNTIGNHTVGITATNITFVPNESVQAILTFKLQAPAPPTNIKVK